jgi:hypothetical protein
MPHGCITSVDVPVRKNTTSGTVVPRYADLPFHEAIHGRVSWGVFGDEDDLGTLNFVDTEAVLRGIASVRDGRRFNLSLPLDLPDPPLSARLASGPEVERRFVHHRIKLRPTINDDYLDSYFLQSSTQIDGLRHVGARGPSTTVGFQRKTWSRPIGWECPTWPQPGLPLAEFSST